jgi:integrase
MAAPKEITIFPKSPDKSGFVRLHMFVSIKNEPGWFPTKVKCLRDSWDQKSQKIKSTQIEYKKLNGILRKRLGQLQEVFDALEYEKTAAYVELVRAKYNAMLNFEITGQLPKIEKQNYKFLDFMDLYVKERANLRAKGYLRLFKSTRKHVASVIENPSFSDITMKFYTDLVDHFVDTEEVENNTMYGNIKRIKTVMGAALIDPRTKHQDIPTDFKLFDDLYVKPKVLWLDWDTEIACIEAFDPLPEMVDIKKFFLFLCYTGLRHSDAFSLRPENFIKKKDSIFLDHTIIKTRLDHNIELSTKAAELVRSWKFKVPKIYQHDLNAEIKRIAKAAGDDWKRKRGLDSPLINTIERVRFSGSERLVSMIPKYEEVKSHTGRRSFGRRWAERGGDLRYLQIYYGHAALQQTLDYIGWTTSEVNAEMRRVMD